MKNIHAIILLAASLTVTSCDERFGFLSGTNRPPAISFNGASGIKQLTDSLKTSLKTGRPSYDFRLSFSDPERQLKSVTFSISGGTGVVKQDANVSNGSLDISAGVANLNFKPDANGNYKIEFTAADSFEKTEVATLELNVFTNLLPIASFTESKLAINSPYEYQFDAKGSFDQDKNKGGGVQAYRYLINNTVEIITQQQIIKYVFPGTGGQEVKLEVYDNDGAKSTVFTKVIQVN